MQNDRFSSKIALRLKNVCYKVYSCENCQRQRCRAFIGLTTHAKMIGGDRPFLPKILGQTDRVGAKLPIFIYIFSLEKSSIITNGNSTTRFPMRPRGTLCVVLPPNGWLKNAKCPLIDKLRYLRNGTR